MYSIKRTIEGFFRKVPELPTLQGDAFVFGAAPHPIVPTFLLGSATLLTANASQAALDPYGVFQPDFTLMRQNMGRGTEIDLMKLEALRDRHTRRLVLLSYTADRQCKAQLAALDRVNYTYDELLLLKRVDLFKIHNQLLQSRHLGRLKVYNPSAGMRAILLSLAMGAERVIVSGLSFRSSGSSIGDIDYSRIHIKGDLEIFARLKELAMPVFTPDPELAQDADLALLVDPAAHAPT